MNSAQHSEEKRLLEKHSVTAFTRKLEEDGRILKYIRHRDMPDTVVSDVHGNEIGVEVTYIFYDEDEARILLGKEPRNRTHRHQEAEIIDILNERLEKKAQKAAGYDFSGKLILLIHSPSPLAEEDTFEKFKKSIVIPESRYSEIWLIVEEEEKDDQEIIRLA